MVRVKEIFILGICLMLLCVGCSSATDYEPHTASKEQVGTVEIAEKVPDQAPLLLENTGGMIIDKNNLIDASEDTILKTYLADMVGTTGYIFLSQNNDENVQDYSEIGQRNMMRLIW